MRFLILLICIFNFLSITAQVASDSTRLTGTVKDTAIGRELIDEAKLLISQRKLIEANAKLELAKQIFSTHKSVDSISLGNMFHQFGRNRQGGRYWDEAITFYLKAIEIRIAKLGEDNVDVASSFFNIGTCMYELGQYSNARTNHEKALGIREKKLGYYNDNVALSFINLGMAYGQLHDYPKQEDCYRHAEKIYLKLFGPESEKVAICFNNLGAFFYKNSEIDSSIIYYEKALNIFLKQNGPESINASYCYTNLSVCKQRIGDYQNALVYAEKALKIQEKTGAGKSVIIANIYETIGGIYCRLGDFEKALNYFEKSLSDLLELLKPNHIRLADSYSNIGVALEGLERYEQSLKFHQIGLDILLNNLDHEDEEIAAALNNIGICYEKDEDHEHAIESLEKALKIRKQKLIPDHFDIAMTHFNLGCAYFKSGNIEAAFEHYLDAEKIWKKNQTLENPAFANLLSHLGELYSSQNLDKQAEIYFEKALIANNYQIDSFSRCLSLIHLKYTLSAMLDFYYKMGTVSFDSVLLEKANWYAAQVISLIDYQRKSISQIDSKNLLSVQNSKIYEKSVKLNTLLGERMGNKFFVNHAFNSAEKSKAQFLFEQIKANYAVKFAGIPDSLVENDNLLKNVISSKEKEINALQELNLSEKKDSLLFSISSTLLNFRNKHEKFLKYLELEYPDYYRLKYDLSTVSLDYVQDTLLQPGQTLLEYFVGDSAVYIFTVRPDTFSVTEVKKDFPLEDWVKQLRHGLYDYYQSGSADPVYYDSTAGEYTQAAYRIYDKLIAPVAGLITDNLIVVPDGVLGYVPFEALLTKQPAVPRRFYSHSYFGKERRISYAYSATLLREMRDKRHKTEPSGSLLALAPFSRDDVKALREQLDTLSEFIALRSDTLPVLRNSGREALVAEKIFKGNALLGSAATKDTFQQLAGNYRILHLSTHGKANDKIGDYAYLGFGLPGNTSGFDKLYVKDIYNLSLKADLVVLSACETGIGQLQRGEGIISLARAFAYAGAKSIVTTLWQVDDARTSRLMQGFYKNLYKGMPKDEALWRVKRNDFMESKTDAHPFFWAGFIPMGDMRAIKN